jgi:hypothetical protein
MEAPPMKRLAAVSLLLLTFGQIGFAQDTRTFRMGFTPFPYDITPEAVTETRTFLRENADIIAFHMESVPWTEALSGAPFRAGLMGDWEYKRDIMPESAATYVAISPGRDGLGNYWGDEENQPVPAGFADKQFDHPDVKAAFTNYALRAVEYFDPAYLAIGIEVNELHGKGVDKWEAYAELHRHVYQAVKADHPRLPVFASFTLHNMLDWQGKPDEAMIAAYDDLMPYNDVVAVSFYPFIGGLSARVDESLAWLTGHYDALGKSYVVTETGEAAERLTFPSTGQVIANTPEMQRHYYERLLALAQERQFAFVISFLYRDYDALWDKIKEGSPEFFMAWRDCGLVDESGIERPARAVWQAAYERPLAQ